MSTYKAIYFRSQVPTPPLEGGERFQTHIIVDKSSAWDVSRKGDFYVVDHPDWDTPVEVHASGVLCAHLAARGASK